MASNPRRHLVFDWTVRVAPGLSRQGSVRTEGLVRGGNKGKSRTTTDGISP